VERVVSKAEAYSAVIEARREGKRVALVPTMGALHDGHLSLVRAARQRADYVVASVFVNPTQFGPGEDFASYPRDLDGDLDVLAAEGCDLVFTPTTEVMYAADAQVTVDPGPLGQILEGAVRPAHFRGVCTVVTKLFAITRPHLAFFGEKDFQQLHLIGRMVGDLDLSVKVVGCPTVRESDGLAMSSRNAYLSREERAAATVLYRALRTAETLALDGERDAEMLILAMASCVAEEPLATLDYAAVVDPDTFGLLDLFGAKPARALIAARIGATRLIDNLSVEVC
jgi:pantoate--beta-alanine ligase